MQHRSVSHARYRVWTRRVENRKHLVTLQVIDQRLIGLLLGDCVHAPGLVEARRQSVLEEPKERVDGREPGIACSGRVAAFGLDMLEERQEELHIELFDLERGWPDLEPIGGKAHQELEARRIRLTGVRTCPALFRQVLAQEAAQVGGERGHAAPPTSNASPALAIWAIRTGVACRYQ